MSLARKVFSFSLFTMISRIFGYLRDVVLASKLGTGLLNDAFIVAFRLPNLFRAIFAEGALNNSFVPIYSSEKDRVRANLFAANTRNILALFLAMLSLVMIAIMPFVVRVMAPGLIDEGDTISNAILFSRITFGYIFFISLAALYGSIMNAHGKFIPFASAPILLNLSIIGFLWFGDWFENFAKAASYGILAAGVLQFAWVWIFMKIYGIKLPRGGFKIIKESKLMLKRMVPIVIASGFIQINLLIDNIFASLENGAISYLYFANRLNQLPLSLIGISLGVVALPSLAKFFKEDQSKALRMQEKALIFAVFFTVPATFGLFFLSYEIIQVLLERGEFDLVSTKQTARALTAYAVGLPAWVLQKIMLANFHSRGDTVNPLKYSIIAIILNIILNAVFFYLFGFIGVALASSVAVYVNLLLLYNKAKYERMVQISKSTWILFAKTIFAAIIMILSVKYYLAYYSGTLNILLSFALGFVVYMCITFALGINLRKLN